MARSVGQFASNVRLGIRAGLATAVAFSLVATAIYVIAGPKPFADNHVTFFPLLLAYAAAGTTIGALVGGSLPFLRHVPVLLFVGALGGTIAGVCMRVAQGNVTVWTRDDVFVLKVFAVLGAICAVMGRSRLRAVASRRDSAPRAPNDS